MQNNITFPLKEAVATNTEFTLKSIAQTMLKFQLDKPFITLTALLSVSLCWMQGEETSSTCCMSAQFLK